jgi:hypothetical protein
MLRFAMICLQLHINEIIMFGIMPIIDSTMHDHKGDVIDLSTQNIHSKSAL